MKQAIVINSEIFGSGSEELGRQLMGSFLRKLWGSETKPSKIVFYNSGVKLMAEGSPVLEALDGLSEAGVELVACGTCVNYYKLRDKIVVGRVGDMSEIVATMMSYNSITTC